MTEQPPIVLVAEDNRTTRHLDLTPPSPPFPKGKGGNDHAMFSVGSGN
jgi:hypothetical protein